MNRWKAVAERDPRADGQFVFGVRSTGIYCRPSCPAKRPNAQNVVFFNTPHEAEQTGFRACKRCHPQEVPLHARVIGQVLKQLEEAEDKSIPLATLGCAVGLSPFHLQRLFKRWVGLSPRQYAAAHRLDILKTKLRGQASVTDALYDSGYNTPRALYESASNHLGMSPGRYRQGGKQEVIHYTTTPTPYGPLLTAATASGICAVRFGKTSRLVPELKKEFPNARLVRDAKRLAPLTQRVQKALQSGKTPGLSLDLRGTPFQQRVWRAIREIPAGQTASYSDLARRIGRPAAVRAVARACATNPVALLVPCHRVLRRNGALGGFRWGLNLKRRLLARERHLTFK